MTRYTFFIAVLLSILPAANAVAQSNSDRGGTWEFGIHVFDQPSEDLTGQEGTLLDIGSDVGWGVSASYHVNDHVEVMFDFSYARPDYQAIRVLEGSLIRDSIRAELDIYSYQFKGVYNFVDGPFTPFVAAAAGWTTMDSNIADGPPTTGCWYDPWWGYVCDSYFSTYSKTRFSYGAAAGLRFDTRNGIGIKASYGIQEIDTSNATTDASFEALRVDLVWRY